MSSTTEVVISPTFPPIRSLITGDQRRPVSDLLVLRNTADNSKPISPPGIISSPTCFNIEPEQQDNNKALPTHKSSNALKSPKPQKVTRSPAQRPLPLSHPLRILEVSPVSVSATPQPAGEQRRARVATGESIGGDGQGHRTLPVRSLSSLRRNKVTLLKCLHLSEDNARFMLLGLILFLYAIIGAVLFMFIEADAEMAELERRLEIVRRFRLKYPRVTRADLNDLLEIKLFLHNTHQNYQYKPSYSTSSSEEVFTGWNNTSRAVAGGTSMNNNRRWTFSGALYFVYTLMTTTGFGMTTPRTKTGRVVTVVYGFFGCTSTILFFNLFLERVITLLTLVMTKLHRWAEKRWMARRHSLTSTHLPRLGLLGLIVSNPDQMAQKLQADGTFGGFRQAWKPSLYAVFCLLFFMSHCAVLVCSTTFALMEDTWTFLDSIYASFIAVATIGFGDFVPAFSAITSPALSSSGYLSLRRRATSNNMTTTSSSYFSSSPSSSSSPFFSSSSSSPQPTPEWYRVIAILSLGFGTCCYYSLFNVSSILVKRFLTVVINKLDVDITSVYDKCWRKQKSRFYKARRSRPIIDPESGNLVGESEMKRRKSVIAHLRAAAVDRAMAKYDRPRLSQTGATLNLHNERLVSVTSKGDDSSTRRPRVASSTAKYNKALPNEEQTDIVDETSFSPSTSFVTGNLPPTGAGLMLHHVENRMAKSASTSSSLITAGFTGRLRTTSSTSLSTQRGRPKPQNVHPTVFDSDDDEDEVALGEGDNDNFDINDDSDMALPKRSSDFRSEALKKVGMMKNNAIVLALMQKQLHAEQTRLQEAADVEAGRNNATFDQPVGPLAIAKNMLE